MNEEISVLAPAKINLFLDVISKRPDGYHDISSVMQTVGIFDRVTVEKLDAAEDECKIDVVCDREAPSGEENVAYAAARAFFEAAQISSYAVKIEISKRIPVCAGLGGGSSDAAAVIIALNELYNTQMTLEDMMSTGAKVGADVPFCIKKGTCHVGGIGEIIQSCTPMPDCTIVVAVPRAEKISTKEAYAKIDKIKTSGSTDKIKDALAECSLEALKESMFNKFELILPKSSAVLGLKSKLIDAGASAALMSGSGSAVFGLFYEIPAAKAAAEALSDEAETFVCAPVRRSYPFIET